MARIGDRVSWLEGEVRHVATLIDVGECIPVVFVQEDGQPLRMVELACIEQVIEIGELEQAGRDFYQENAAEINRALGEMDRRTETND